MVLRLKLGPCACTVQLSYIIPVSYPRNLNARKNLEGLERAPQLRPFVVLTEDPDLFPRTQSEVHNHPQPWFRGSNDLFCPPQAPGMYVVHIHTLR